MAPTKIKVAMVTLLCVAVATSFVIQHRALRRLQAEKAVLQQQLADSQQSQAIQPTTNAPDSEELDRLRAERTELLRLRGQVVQLRNERDELLRRPAASPTPPTMPTTAAPDTAWIQGILNSPPAQKGSAAGLVRAKLLRGGRTNAPSASDMALQQALLQQNLNQTLERSPTEFADFQTAFIEAALGLTDPVKREQIRELIRQTYEHAVAHGLDIPSKPTTEPDAWVQRRHQLDRRATSALQQVLSPEERSLFDRAFLGVMGVDLGGVGVDKSNYPPGFLGAD